MAIGMLLLVEARATAPAVAQAGTDRHLAGQVQLLLADAERAAR